MKICPSFAETKKEECAGSVHLIRVCIYIYIYFFFVCINRFSGWKGAAGPSTIGAMSSAAMEAKTAVEASSPRASVRSDGAPGVSLHLFFGAPSGRAAAPAVSFTASPVGAASRAPSTPLFFPRHFDLVTAFQVGASPAF